MAGNNGAKKNPKGESVYDDSSIRALKGADRVRKRAGVMFGSDDIVGAFRTVHEIVANSFDESRAGYGKVIEIEYLADKSIRVKDEGRGIPLGWNADEGRFNWDLIFNELYAGGKYEEDGGNYEFALGLNGLGAAAVQYSSKWLKVVSIRSDVIRTMSFESGIPVGKMVETPNKGKLKTGTEIHWLIDNDVFPDTNFTAEMFERYCEEQAHLNSLTVRFKNGSTGEEREYVGTTLDAYLASKIDGEIVDTLVSTNESQGTERGKPYRARIEIAILVTEECKSKYMYFHNTSRMTEGVHLSAASAAISQFFEKEARKNGVSILQSDYRDYMSLIISSYSTSENTSFANQTKTGVTNTYIMDLVYSTVLDTLEEAYARQKGSISELVQNVINAALARKKAREIENQFRAAKKMAGRRKQPEKLVDCRSTDPSITELYIVEGDSALGSAKLGRNSDFQAILPVKGKTLNCIKAAIKDIMKSEVINSITLAVGTGIEIDHENSTFDINGLNYSKILICTDADVDGYHIRVLLFSVFYRLMPQLLEGGFVHIVESPLFEIELSDGTSVFVYTPEEKDYTVRQLEKEGKRVVAINRSKGLGENTPQMMWDTTMNPETRRTVPLTVDCHDPFVREVVDMLFGMDKNKGRKEFIEEMLGISMTELIEEAMSMVDVIVKENGGELLSLAENNEDILD